MASLLFPDTGTRMVLLPSGAQASGRIGTLYAAATGTTLAEVYAHNGTSTPGALIATAQITLDQYGQQPDYWGPAAGTDSLYLEVNGVRSRVNADYDARLDAVESRVFAVAAPTGIAATDTAAIVAAANAANAAGGGTVALRRGTYELNATLPVLAGVTYQGVPPVLVSQNVGAGYLPDGEWNYAGGTILHGTGAFPAFSANTTPLGAVPASLGLTQIGNAGIKGVGLDNFTYGIQVGNTNTMGMVWGELDEIYVKNCTQWGVWLVNFQHVKVGVIRTSQCTVGGQYYGVLMPGATVAPGNSLFADLFHKVPNQGMSSRGIVFEAGGVNAVIGEIDVLRVQVNGYNKTLISQVATFTNASTTVAVTDGTKYLPGMCVNFTATGFGFTINQIYVIASVAGNNLTLANSRSGAAITATGAGTLTMQSYGFPCLEITAANSGALLSSGRFHDIDTEGVASVGVYVENAFLANLSITAVPATALVHLVGRNAQNCRWDNTYQGAKTDFDSVQGSQFFGARDATYGYPLPGMWYDQSISTYCMSLSGDNRTAAGGLLLWRNNFAYPIRSGIGEHIRSQNSSTTLDGNNCGHILFSAGVAITLTLPTIATALPALSSNIGMWFNIVNVGSATITVNTNGTQLMNKIAGRTTVSVTPGNSLRLVAVEDGSQWWMATPAVLTA